MKFINKSRKNPVDFFEELPSSVGCLVDDLKKDYILDHFKHGFSNRILFEKFSNFKWPLWLQKFSDYKDIDYRTNPNPLLLNTSYREWQTFTNYLSSDEIHIDRAGMISGPRDSAWSVEFWILHNDKIIRPQENISSVSNSRNIKTGEIVISWSTGGIIFTQRISGARSRVDEALISLDISFKKEKDNFFLLAAIRPYNNASIGHVSSIRFNSESALLSINNRNMFGFEKKPDLILSGSGEAGDIVSKMEENSETVECPYGMATMGLMYELNSGKNLFNFRIALDQELGAAPAALNYSTLFKEFSIFTEMRLSENIKTDITDKSFSEAFMQSRLSMLNINNSDIASDDVESYRRLYFFIHALCRIGAFPNAENLLRIKLESFSYNIKKPDFMQIIKGCFLVSSCYELYIHKREADFLQKFYTEMRDIANYIYGSSVEIYTAGAVMGNTSISRLAKNESVSDLLYIFAALSNISYMARCRGIFGDESKFKNESIRIQSIIADSLNSEKYNRLNGSDKAAFGVLSLPEKVITVFKNDEYKAFLNEMISTSGYPIVNSLYGIDSFLSCAYLNHFISTGGNEFKKYLKNYLELLDKYHVLPEYIDPSVKRGTFGDGNSKIINSMIFSLFRNMLFIDGQERLEILPMADDSWFITGSRIKVENAPSRYGIISFTLEVFDKEIRLSLAGSPKYLPPDIMINIPLKTSIVSGDDFIMKKKLGNNYLISGWPSTIRFNLSSTGHMTETEEL